MLKRLNITEELIIFKLTLIGLIIYKFSTLKLWIITERAFVVIPFMDELLVTDLYFHNTISIVSFTLILILIFKSNKVLLLLLIITETLLLATDVMRWQPTVFQFFITLVIYAIRPKQFKTYILLLLSATYIFSGLHKFNMAFINFNWSKVILIDFLGLSSELAYKPLVKGLGFSIPIIEIFSGALLLTKFREKGFYLILFTHLFILIFLGTLGFLYTFPVWSWNFIMLLYALVFLSSSSFKPLKKDLITTLWVFLIFILPIFNFFGKYYPYFSFDMYSGDKHYLYIYTKVENTKLNQYSKNSKNGLLQDSVFQLAYNELSVPFTHNKWLYRRFIKTFEKQYPGLQPCYDIIYYPFASYESFEKFYK